MALSAPTMSINTNWKQQRVSLGACKWINRLVVLTLLLQRIEPASSQAAATNTTTTSWNSTTYSNDEESHQPPYQISKLRNCSQTSLELWSLGPDDALDPCILYDIESTAATAKPEDRSATVTLVQVTPSRCHDHRDGVATGVLKLNEDNEGKGVAIGHYDDFHVRFRLITIIAGNTDHLDPVEYDRRHVELLNDMIETYQPQYIVGTCSWKASLEPAIALQHKKILMAQVGPPGYYTEGNPYVFGFHIDSDNYPLPAIQNLRFYAESHGGVEHQPVKVIYRNKSEFFNSTCRSAINEAKRFGFKDISEIEFDPFGDHDGDQELNSFDVDFLHDLADQACPPGSEQQHFHPAIFVCTIVEQDVLLERWRENGCRPISMWMTAATWAWASANLDVVPSMQGGGQWHKGFDYSDRYFDSGSDLMSFVQGKFGYHGTYDVVAGYSMAVLLSQHIIASYRADDDPSLAIDFFNQEGYEILRRKLLVLTVDTLFGPFSLNRFQRNVGRGAAGSQWLPGSDSSSNATFWESKCISPLEQAGSSGVMPASAAMLCDAGEFLSLDKVQTERALLSRKCEYCPADTTTLLPNSQLQCKTCPEGASTFDREGQTACNAQDPNLLTAGIKSMGYIFVGISWFLAFFFLGWLWIYRRDPVVRISQIEFLVLICFGAIISSSSIIALNFEADVGEDTAAATTACMSIPFLYTIGWVLEYSSLCVKSYRLYRVTNATGFQRVQISVFSMFRLIGVALVCDLVVVVVWTIVSPLEYRREIVNTHWEEATGLITVNTVGECQNSSGTSIWAFVAPLIFLHLSLMICTNVLLWMNRGVEDRYQESKYVAMASVYVFEILVIGLPVLAAVGENTSAKYIVFCSIVFLNDVGILCFIFIPKMWFVREGLPEGVSAGESVVRKSMRDAVQRQGALGIRSHNGFAVYANQHAPESSNSFSAISKTKIGHGANRDSYDDLRWSDMTTTAPVARYNERTSTSNDRTSRMGTGLAVMDCGISATSKGEMSTSSEDVAFEP